MIGESSPRDHREHRLVQELQAALHQILSEQSTAAKMARGSQEIGVVPSISDCGSHS